ncbi:MAG: aminomethyl-transferring glycine dehydrogenase [Paludibacteraceae bacterium]|nr:aminomethyl-transferring glycine dehydrogenase [Paludibacteraceae bacterium]
MKDLLAYRHIGIDHNDEQEMLQTLGVNSVEELIKQIIPDNIRLQEPLPISNAMTEHEYASHIADLAANNKQYKSYIGRGWYDTLMPAVIQRNILENPVWYTSYTPYQAEISQGRLEALMVFQTAVSDMTGLPLANCSMLDEATAAAEAATMMLNLRSREQQKNGANVLFVDEKIFPQTLAVLRTRALGQGIEIEVGNYLTHQFTERHFGAIVQYPNADGSIEDYSDFTQRVHECGCKVAVVADIMALALIKSPGSWGADICVGSTQRWGIPMGFGGPAAAYFATRDEYKRETPGRIIGLSRDTHGRPAYRLALQTREQHIKRERATSNICTAQALMATMAGMYCVYHGADGIRQIAQDIHSKAAYLNEMLEAYGYQQENTQFFDTLKIQLPEQVNTEKLRQLALDYEVNLYYYDDDPQVGQTDAGHVGVSIDQTTDKDDINVLMDIFAQAVDNQAVLVEQGEQLEGLCAIEDQFLREQDYLTASVFKKYHTETEMMRYIKRLDRKDISLTHTMIPLGSCTMKLNPASTMIPISWAQFGGIHPMAPADQVEGYTLMLNNLKQQLCAITGFADCSLQPTSGAAGEYAGLVVIRDFLRRQGQEQRKVLLIPASAHGTNPASCVQAGFTPVVVNCDNEGNIDMADWKAKIQANADTLAGCMITYPSTHGIFEKDVKQMCQYIHDAGGQVYMDGANMNAQVGLTNPATIGADVCHLNFHKTFASPHGGGGPGAGAICVAEHLIESLPGVEANRVSSALNGNAGINEICYGYICMMGADGLKKASEAAILSANYLAERLDKEYGVLYRGFAHRVGHELILDCRQFKTAGVTETDVAKRLMDYGYHAPTLSFPVHGTLMIEPTESESLHELEQFADAMTHIRQEIRDIENGTADAKDNLLLNSPHAEYEAIEDWTHPYTRQQAFYPTEWVAQSKFWIPVTRVDNGWGDRNLIARLDD